MDQGKHPMLQFSSYFTVAFLLSPAPAGQSLNFNLPNLKQPFIHISENAKKPTISVSYP